MSLENPEKNIFHNENRLEEEKPPFLYHGSPFSDLEKINPVIRKFHNEEGLMTFATPDKAFASMFLGPRPDDSWSAKGSFEKTYYILIADEERYRKNDTGGIIYKVSSEKFEKPIKGMKTEWVAKESVEPISSENFDSAFNTMIDNGVQVYFTDQSTINRFNEALKEDYFKGLEAIEGLQSENKKLGKNIKSFRERRDY